LQVQLGLSDIDALYLHFFLNIDAVITQKWWISNNKKVGMGRNQSNDFTTLLTKSILLLPLLQIPNIHSAILVASQNLLLRLFIVLPQMPKGWIDHEKAASSYFWFFYRWIKFGDTHG
jgi:hypothetical protein